MTTDNNILWRIGVVILFLSAKVTVVCCKRSQSLTVINSVQQSRRIDNTFSVTKSAKNGKVQSFRW